MKTELNPGNWNIREDKFHLEVKKVNLRDKYSLNEGSESFEDQHIAETLLKKFAAPFSQQKNI